MLQAIKLWAFHCVLLWAPVWVRLQLQLQLRWNVSSLFMFHLGSFVSAIVHLRQLLTLPAIAFCCVLQAIKLWAFHCVLLWALVWVWLRLRLLLRWNVSSLFMFHPGSFVLAIVHLRQVLDCTLDITPVASSTIVEWQQSLRRYRRLTSVAVIGALTGIAIGCIREDIRRVRSWNLAYRCLHFAIPGRCNGDINTITGVEHGDALLLGAERQLGLFTDHPGNIEATLQ
eukprot:COSAG01_NODE_1511_length_10068_cov_7.643731_2_plen_228_part_00